MKKRIHKSRRYWHKYLVMREMAAKRLAKANAKKKEPETSHQESNNSTLLQDMKKGLNRGRRTR